MAQLLYLSNLSHLDMQLSVSLLCTIVIYTDVYYYKKLTRVMKYIQGTIGLPLIPSIKNMSI